MTSTELYKKLDFRIVSLSRKYGEKFFLNPTKETCISYNLIYICYLDEDYVPHFVRNYVLYKKCIMKAEISMKIKTFSDCDRRVPNAGDFGTK